MRRGISNQTAVDDANAVSILDVARSLNIEVKGKKAMCFDGHDRKTPSLSFTLGKNLWYCHGCGKGGANIQLVMSVLHLSFRDALVWLGRRFHFSVGGVSAGRFHVARRLKMAIKPRFVDTVSAQTDPEVYEWLLRKCPLHNTGRDYLLKRGFSPETIQAFRIGELTDACSLSSASLKQWGRERLLRCGVFTMRNSWDGGLVARLVWWDHTILFPFLDGGGGVVYLQGRRLADDGKTKYLGLSGVPKPLFNGDVLRSLAPGSTVFICEGVPDALSAVEMGLNAVGVLGASSFKDEYVDLLESFQVVVVPDKDAAGSKFSNKVRQAFNDIGMTVEVARLPEGNKDLNEYRLATRSKFCKGKQE